MSLPRYALQSLNGDDWRFAGWGETIAELTNDATITGKRRVLDLQAREIYSVPDKPLPKNRSKYYAADL